MFGTDDGVDQSSLADGFSITAVTVTTVKPRSSAGEKWLEEHTSPREMRQRISEARDYVAVLRTIRQPQPRGNGLETASPDERSWRDYPRAISAEEIRRVAAVFEPPTAYARCQQILAEHHLLLVAGRQGVGKRAAAVRLVDEALGESGVSIIEYDSPMDIGRVRAGVRWRANSGYLVHGLAEPDLAQVTSDALRELAAHLQAIDSYLVLCISAETAASLEVLRSFGAWLEPPSVSTASLLERHLRYDLAWVGEPADVAELMARPEIRGLLQRPLTPQEIGDLSRRLTGVVRGESSMADAIAAWADTGLPDAEEWFEAAGDDIGERAFRIALAAFNGSRYEAVWRAGLNLAACLTPPQPPESTKETSPPASPFADRRADRLQRAGAHLAWMPEPGSPIPGARIEVVLLDSETRPAAALRYVWREYPNLHHTLLKWLDHYAGDAAADLRNRVAAAVGVLAGDDLVAIRDRVLLPWAQHGGPAGQAMIGRALGCMVWNDHCAKDALGLLDSWSNLEDSTLRSAALQAYAWVGLRHPDVAMRHWRTVLTSEGAASIPRIGVGDDWRQLLDAPVRQAVIEAAGQLLLAAAQWPERCRAVCEAVIAALADWCDADIARYRMRRGTAMSLPLFVILAQTLADDSVGDTEPDAWTPVLLEAADEVSATSGYTETLASLFRRALNWPPTRESGLEIIGDWLRRADQHPHLELRLVSLLKAIAGGSGASDRDRQRLAAYLRRWANHPTHPLRSAQVAIQQLHLAN